MAYVSQKDDIMLMIMHDDMNEIDPRKDYDNFGTMTCWHKDYNLGDGGTDGREPKAFIEDLVLESISADRLIKMARTGLYVKLQYDRTEKGYDILNRDRLNERFSNYEFIEGKMEDVKSDLAVSIVQAMNMSELIKLAEINNIILPLYLYNHSILSMSTESFVGREVHAEWDSGQIGWIHATREDIKNEFKEVTKKTVDSATERLKSEVKTYDSYLQNEVYGFKLFRNGEETDSCWGFIGDIDEIKSSIAYYLPDEDKNMLDSLEYINENETQIYESEYEEEYEMPNER